MTRPALAALAALTGFLLGGAAPPACPPADLPQGQSPLTALRAALHSGGTLNVLAAGTSPWFAAAPGATRPGGAPAPGGFVGQATHALEAAYRGLRINLTLRGGRGLTAADMAGPIAAEVARGHYQLVIWQTGTVDAVREVAPAEFYQTLADTAASVAASGADLVLVDPQYSRFLEANANVEPYLSTMQDLAALPGVSLFPRYALMRNWADAGAIDLERSAKGERAAAGARLQLCLGQALARLLRDGT